MVYMGRPTVRVSEWASIELRRRAKAEGRTVVSVIDRLMNHRVSEEVEAIAAMPKVEGGIPVAGVGQAAKDIATNIDRNIVDYLTKPSFVESRTPCPKCGCSRAMHLSGSRQTRCERHPSCVWT
jgi:hypothetical protein